jgi:putative phage-type endonuclease
MSKKRLGELRKKVTALSKIKMHPQKSPEWFKQRQTKITASEAASCLYKTKEDCSGYLDNFVCNTKLNGKQLNSFKSRDEYIVSKCLEYYGTSQYTDNHSTLHGKRFEDVAVNLYCNLKKTDIIEFGLLSHPTIDWLAASPDGITPDGVMLEIKCPNVRKIKPNEFPIYYWVQMQIQLEVCDLDECDYLECSIKEISEEEFYDIESSKSPGFILRKPGTEEYVYPPKNIITVMDHLIWIGFHSQELECVFYYIESYQILNVKRDKVWFNNVKDKLKETFDVVTSFQNDIELWNAHYKTYLDAKHKKFNDSFEATVCTIEDDVIQNCSIDEPRNFHCTIEDDNEPRNFHCTTEDKCLILDD